MTTEKGTETFTYNSMGGIETRQQGSDLTIYLYDSAGRLIEVRTSEGIVRYEYDAYGRLTKTEDDKTTIRLPFGNETAYEKVIQQGSPTIEYKYIIALNRYLARDERTGQGSWQRTYYHQDYLGSTRTLSGTDSGSLAYAPFGSVLQEAGSTETHSYRFTGKPLHSTGLYYYGARFYDPELGRFISMDPAMDGLNWYVYAASNPLKYTDPDGKAYTLTLGWAGSMSWLCALDGPLPFGDMLYAAGTVSLAVGETVYLYGDKLPGIVDSVRDYLAELGGTSGGSSGGGDPNRLQRLLKFIEDNFRNNLSRWTGRTPPSNVHAHHILPKEFANQFMKDFGINVHEPWFGVWIEQGAHIVLHNMHKYNKMWGAFLTKSPTPTSEELARFLAEIIVQFKFPINF
ncbi:MAG: RHS repeat-associated core domain-containing protein [Limnochordia bacterium]